MAKKKKNDAYAICTAQKKKSGMGHDEWKRCVNKVQQQESVMNFYERVAKLVEGNRPHKPDSGRGISRVERGKRERGEGDKPELTDDEWEAKNKKATQGVKTAEARDPYGIRTPRKQSRPHSGAGYDKQTRDREEDDMVRKGTASLEREKTKRSTGGETETGRSIKKKPIHPPKTTIKLGDKKPLNASKKKVNAMKESFYKRAASLWEGHGDEPGETGEDDEAPGVKSKEGAPKKPSKKRVKEQDSETKKQIDKGARGDDDTEDWAKKLSSPQKGAETPVERAKRLKKEKDDENTTEESFYTKLGNLLREKKMTNVLPSGPKQSKAPDDEEEAELDAEDTMEANVKGPDTDPDAESDKAKELAKKGQEDPTPTDTGWQKKRKIEAAKKSKLKKKVGEEKDWIQKAVNPKHKGYCTPMTKSTCTPARKALAKRFKKAARKEKKSGGTGWQGKV